MKKRHRDLSLEYIESIPSGRSGAEPMPLVLVLHGRGADANDLADLAPMIDNAPGYRFIFPDAPRAFEAYPGMVFGKSWFDGWPPEGDSLTSSREKLLRFIGELRERYGVSTMALTGFSQGGVMSVEAGFRIDPAPEAIVVMSGAMFENDLPDLRARSSQPVLIIHGTSDDVIPILAPRRMRMVLEEHGLRPEYHELEMAHQVTEESMSLVRTFLAKYC